jgi:hypothetical protein
MLQADFFATVFICRPSKEIAIFFRPIIIAALLRRDKFNLALD